jgi:sulfur carrier protein
MMIDLNGKAVDQGGAKYVDALLQSMNIEGAAIVIERNGVILKKEEWPLTPVVDDDHIEVIRFVGGG